MEARTKSKSSAARRANHKRYRRRKKEREHNLENRVLELRDMVRRVEVYNALLVQSRSTDLFSSCQIRCLSLATYADLFQYGVNGGYAV